VIDYFFSYAFTSFVFGHIGYYYLLMWVAATYRCASIDTNTAFKCAIFLGAIAFAGWNSTLWQSPANMAAWHLLIVVSALIFFNSKIGLRLAFLTLCMMVVDIFYVFRPEPLPDAMNSAFPVAS